MVLLVFLALGFGPLGYVSGRVGQLADLVEQRDGQTECDKVVAPDPLILEVVLDRELGQLGGEGVRELHRARRRLRHLDLLDSRGTVTLQLLQNKTSQGTRARIDAFTGQRK
uniref:(northern house mosquito) hypothetical protein n=1 Tax=Culex pipiens TaxID=7175 RepID=A0A8D8MKC0_CULPI